MEHKIYLTDLIHKAKDRVKAEDLDEAHELYDELDRKLLKFEKQRRHLAESQGDTIIEKISDCLMEVEDNLKRRIERLEY